jgi:hypothetical protein
MATIMTVARGKNKAEFDQCTTPHSDGQHEFLQKFRGKLKYPGVHSVRRQKWKIALLADFTSPQCAESR